MSISVLHHNGVPFVRSDINVVADINVNIAAIGMDHDWRLRTMRTTVRLISLRN